LLGVEGVHRGWWLLGQLVVVYQVSNHLGETGSDIWSSMRVNIPSFRFSIIRNKKDSESFAALLFFGV
jgi:hypothetical protein